MPLTRVPDKFSLLMAIEGCANDPTMTGSKVPFPYLGVAGRPDRNHTPGQPPPLKSGFLSLK